MSLIGSILDPLLPDPSSPSQPDATTPPVITQPQPTTTNDPPPPVTTSIIHTIPTPEPSVPTPAPQPNPDPTKNPRPQPTTTRNSGSNPGGNPGGNSRPIGPTPPTIGPSTGVTGPGNGTSADVQRDSNSTGSGSTATIIGTLVGVAAAVVLILAGLLFWRKRQQKKQSFEALFGSSSLAAASGMNNDNDTTDSIKPIYARDVEDSYRENKPVSSPPPLAPLEPAYGGGEQNYYQQHPSSAMSPVQAASAPQGAYEHYDPYYQQGGGEAYNMQDFNAYNQAGGYDQYDYGQYGDYPATSSAGPAATNAHQDDLDSMAYYPYDQGAQGYNSQQPSYSTSGRRRP
ncbi:hypothetical protein BGZ73_005827 [Actinomortierella ambigua]|nr:hypothetical protein BGZ73_005827 [Actinomortierella ambigua]